MNLLLPRPQRIRGEHSSLVKTSSYEARTLTEIGPEERNKWAFHQRALGALPWAHDPLEPLQGPAAQNAENAEGNGATEYLFYQKQLVRFPE